MNSLRRGVLGGAAAAAMTMGLSGIAAAGPVNQNGLVNVNLTDVTVQIPIALAANVCDVNVAVLVSALTDVGAADCTASSNSDATVTRTAGSSGPIRQRGLVNVNVTDLDVQVPVGIAANICDVNAGVLVGLLTDVGAADCAATGTAGAISR